jgi:hypothetical protein
MPSGVSFFLRIFAPDFQHDVRLAKLPRFGPRRIFIPAHYVKFVLNIKAQRFLY